MDILRWLIYMHKYIDKYACMCVTQARMQIVLLFLIKTILCAVLCVSVCAMAKKNNRRFNV